MCQVVGTSTWGSETGASVLSPVPDSGVPVVVPVSSVELGGVSVWLPPELFPSSGCGVTLSLPLAASDVVVSEVEDVLPVIVMSTLVLVVGELESVT